MVKFPKLGEAGAARLAGWKRTASVAGSALAGTAALDWLLNDLRVIGEIVQAVQKVWALIAGLFG